MDVYIFCVLIQIYFLSIAVGSHYQVVTRYSINISREIMLIIAHSIFIIVKGILLDVEVWWFWLQLSYRWYFHIAETGSVFLKGKILSFHKNMSASVKAILYQWLLDI